MLEISHSLKYKNDEKVIKAHQKLTKIDEKTLMKTFSSFLIHIYKYIYIYTTVPHLALSMPA
jgi:hypothetical protein